MPKLRNMTGETGSVEIPIVGDEPLVVVYRRASITPSLQARAVEAQRLMASDKRDQLGPEHVLVICDMLARAIVSWNLTDDDGLVMAHDPTTLAELDFATLNLIADAIRRESEPDPLSEGGSSSGSSAMASSGPRLITTAS